MSPDKRSRRRRDVRPGREQPLVRVRPSSDDAHRIVYFQRHQEDDSEMRAPGREFLQGCPSSVRAQLRAVLAQVAAAPPKKFSGGGYWEAMHGDMTGWFEARVNGPKRRHYRLYCLLDYDAAGRDDALLVVIDGRSKEFRTELTDADYRAVRQLGDEYRSRNPRSLVGS